MFNYIYNSRILLVYTIPFIIGMGTVFTFQPYNITFLNFIILPLLFLILCSINKRSKNIYRKKAYLRYLFLTGYSFGFGFFLTGTYWISNSLQFDENFKDFIPVVIILLPLFLGLFFALATMISGIFLKFDFKSILIFSAMMSIFDYLRSKIFTGFPWNLWAYSWSWLAETLQILNPIGVFAFNLIVITIFTIPAILFFKKEKYKFIYIIFSALLFFFNYIYGDYIINKNRQEYANTIKEKKFINIKVVSPNFKLKYDLNEEELDKRVKKLIKYSDPDKDKKTLFIWPEGSLSGQYFEEIVKYKNLIEKNFSKNHLIIFGVNTKSKKNDDFYNSFLVIDNDFKKQFEYNKIKLVPFGEFLPFENLFYKFNLKKITEGFGSFSKGMQKKTFDYNNLQIIPLICYEIIFTDLLQKHEVNQGLIINISEDAWFGNSIGPYQHFSKAIFRAVESNKFIIRSANKGISAIISNNGKIIKSLKNNEIGSLEYKMPILEKDSRNKNDLIFLVLLFTYVLIFLIFKKNEK